MAQNRKSINPKKVQRTEADVRRAYDKGFSDGLRDLLDVMVYTLGADMEMDDDWLDFFHDRFMKNMECHYKGELTTHDLRSTVYEEKGWEVQIK